MDEMKTDEKRSDAGKRTVTPRLRQEIDASLERRKREREARTPSANLSDAILFVRDNPTRLDKGYFERKARNMKRRNRARYERILLKLELRVGRPKALATKEADVDEGLPQWMR